MKARKPSIRQRLLHKSLFMWSNSVVFFTMPFKVVVTHSELCQKAEIKNGLGIAPRTSPDWVLGLCKKLQKIFWFLFTEEDLSWGRWCGARPFIHPCLLWWVAALQAIKQASLLSPASWCIYLEVPETQPGTCQVCVLCWTFLLSFKVQKDDVERRGSGEYKCIMYAKKKGRML